MKATVYLDKKTCLLMSHVKQANEPLSAFVQRLVREEAARRGLEVVVTEVRSRPV